MTVVMMSWLHCGILLSKIIDVYQVWSVFHVTKGRCLLILNASTDIDSWSDCVTLSQWPLTVSVYDNLLCTILLRIQYKVVYVISSAYICIGADIASFPVCLPVQDIHKTFLHVATEHFHVLLALTQPRLAT